MTAVTIYQGFKRGIDLIKAINDLDKTVNLNTVKAELQSIILEAQAAQFALVDQVRELEKEVADLEAWNTEKQRYDLKEIHSGVFAYALKPDAQPPETTHNICQNCYNNGRKSVLQKEWRAVGRTEVYICHGCNAELIVKGMRQEGHIPLKVVTKRPNNY